MIRIDPSRLRAAERIKDMGVVRIRELLDVDAREAMRIRADAIALMEQDKADALREDIDSVSPRERYQEVDGPGKVIPELGNLVEFVYNGSLRAVEVAKLVDGRLEGFELWKGDDFVAFEGTGNYKAYRIDRMETTPEVVA